MSAVPRIVGMGKKTSVYLSDDLAEAIRASGQSIPDLIRLGLQAAELARANRLADAVEQLAGQAEKLTGLLQEGYRIVPRGTE